MSATPHSCTQRRDTTLCAIGRGARAMIIKFNYDHDDVVQAIGPRARVILAGAALSKAESYPAATRMRVAM